MKVVESRLPGVLILEPAVHRDPRGFFLETYRQDAYHQAGITLPFVQDNHSRSARRTLRGLHAQEKHPQGKLIRSVRGAVLDVAVDIRVGSPTFGQWMSVELSDENFRQCYVPPGFAHGFLTLSEFAEVEYKCTDYYHPDDELHILWNDPDLGISWPETAPLLSEKDRSGSRLKDLRGSLPRYAGSVNSQ